jgi:hypothetical protein
MKLNVKKPGPLEATIARNLCPVCGKASYSLGGTHPQCAIAREDADIRAKRLAAGVVVPRSAARTQWMKTCPQCQRQMASRRYVCDCGHTFGAAALAALPGNIIVQPNKAVAPQPLLATAKSDTAKAQPRPTAGKPDRRKTLGARAAPATTKQL